MSSPPPDPGPGGRWDDLATRVVTGVALAVLCLAAIWVGGLPFTALCALGAGLMTWELARMQGAARLAPGLGLAGALAVAAAPFLPWVLAIPLLLLPGAAAVALGLVRWRLFWLFSAIVGLGSFGFVVQRTDYGLSWMLWLALVVMVTDIAGYFVGRRLGGPKLWPRVSPKKTWSGTLGGWAAAALVGLGFWATGLASAAIVPLSVVLAMASQAGDIAESAVKRRAGVKDSSALLPGHGGLFDRFDGMLGASVALLAIEAVSDFPPLAG